jgi:hypothetical protein
MSFFSFETLESRRVEQVLPEGVDNSEGGRGRERMY